MKRLLARFRRRGAELKPVYVVMERDAWPAAVFTSQDAADTYADRHGIDYVLMYRLDAEYGKPTRD